MANPTETPNAFLFAFPVSTPGMHTLIATTGPLDAITSHRLRTGTVTYRLESIAPTTQ
ncbi:hypothetical protein C486_17764 [Natrinema gari JCM 14663]|uniref:Uncharacterized protein n=1 Tax=Natrinema gari JCM 14663 TaxID=1230459 RepID=L9YTQ5_9EURY|nr:hypothetical protein C486_17764 [Natrinema gari JCM 14663]